MTNEYETLNTEILPVEKAGELSTNEECGSFLTMMTASQYAKLKAAAAAIKEEEAVVLTAIYKEFAVGETVSGIFTGMDGITPKTTDELTGEITKRFTRSVQWMGKDGKLYQCAGVALVNQFWDEESQSFKIPPGSKITITHTGKNNRTKLYQVGLIPD